MALQQHPPPYKPDKKQNILSWIDGYKHAKLIRALIIVCIILLCIGLILWLFSYIMQGYNEGGVTESDNRMQHILSGLFLKLSTIPLFPI